MRILKIFGTFVVVAGINAAAIANASATTYLRNGVSLTAELAADWHGEVIIHHTGGFGGTELWLCTGLFHGTVGPGPKARSTEELGLNGEKNKIKCVVHTGNGLCPAGTEIEVTADGLPWSGELTLEGTLTVGNINGTGTEMGYSTTCGGISITCNRNQKNHFAENLANGALFILLGTIEASCNDGGKGTLLGMTELLGFTVS